MNREDAVWVAEQKGGAPDFMGPFERADWVEWLTDNVAFEDWGVVPPLAGWVTHPTSVRHERAHLLEKLEKVKTTLLRVGRDPVFAAALHTLCDAFYSSWSVTRGHIGAFVEQSLAEAS